METKLWPRNFNFELDFGVGCRVRIRRKVSTLIRALKTTIWSMTSQPLIDLPQNVQTNICVLWRRNFIFERH